MLNITEILLPFINAHFLIIFDILILSKMSFSESISMIKLFNDVTFLVWNLNIFI